MTTRSLATRRHPTMATAVANAANVVDDKVPRGGRRRPTTADLDDDEATNGGHSCPTADAHDDEVRSAGRYRPSKAPLASQSSTDYGMMIDHRDGAERGNGIPKRDDEGGLPRRLRI